MAGLKSTLVRAAIALLIVEGVVSANRASMMYRREVNLDGMCLKTANTYDGPCCGEGIANAEKDQCYCRCVAAVTVAEEETAKQEFYYCEDGQGITTFTLVPSGPDEIGDSAGGTGSTGHSTRPNGIESYMMWIVIVFTVIIYVNQIAQ